ncbi:hypothetical protein V3C99_010280 [Haemonchus contortus]
MMIIVPKGQILVSIYGWLSICMYLYMVIKIVLWRRQNSLGKRQFRSSYYTLFMLQAVADFYAFLAIELIQKPAAFNYFNLSLDKMHSLAVVSYSTIVISSSLISCGHVLIALNRMTAFYRPNNYEQIWNRFTVFGSVFTLWAIFIIHPLPFIILYEHTIHFVVSSDGSASLSSSVMDHMFAIIACTRSAATIILCSIFYICSFIKCRQMRSGKTLVERRLLICALASSAGFIPNFIGAVILTTIPPAGNEKLLSFTVLLWFYENEIMATIAVWLQLLLNKNVRQHIFPKRKTRQEEPVTFTM